MNRDQKAAAIEEVAGHIKESEAVFAIDYRGISVPQAAELRTRLTEAGARFRVVKNTLTKIAAERAGVTGLDDLLVGPTGVAFIGGDPVEAAKVLREFGRANQALVVKGGFVEGKAMSADDIRKLADLESREVLLAKLAGAMNGSLAKAVGLFAAPLSQAARLAEALRAKREAEGATEASAQPEPAVAAE